MFIIHHSLLLMQGIPSHLFSQTHKTMGKNGKLDRINFCAYLLFFSLSNLDYNISLSGDTPGAICNYQNF